MVWRAVGDAVEPKRRQDRQQKDKDTVASITKSEYSNGANYIAQYWMECFTLSDQYNEWMRERRTNHNQGLTLTLIWWLAHGWGSCKTLHLRFEPRCGYFPYSPHSLQSHQPLHHITDVTHLLCFYLLIAPPPPLHCTVSSPRLGMLLLSTAGSLFCAWRLSQSALTSTEVPWSWVNSVIPPGPHWGSFLHHGLIDWWIGAIVKVDRRKGGLEHYCVTYRRL